MVGWDISIIQAVDKQDRNLAIHDCPFWRSILHIQAIPQSHVEKTDIYAGSKESSPQPRPNVKGTTEPGIGDLAESRERRLSNDCAKARFFRQRLQQFCGSHGLAKPVHAAWVVVCLNPIHPFVNVVRLPYSVSRQSSAIAVVASVGK